MRRPVSALSLRVLQHPEGNATVTDLSGGERRVSVSPRDPALFIRVRECTTRYPDDLIETVLAVKGIGALCDEIEREELPAALGRFDVIVFSAVFEHLLARERAVVIPQVWSVLAPGGVLLVGETPHRWTPVELHTTGGL